ncbi:MAG: hypothetical protein ABIG96_06300 [Candidatus Micrarchaeota archaeon]
MAKGKGFSMNCGDHWYLDGIMMLLGLGYLIGTDGWGAVNFTLSYYLPPFAMLFLFLGLKMYLMKHG